jgi:hypothetical protein
MSETGLRRPLRSGISEPPMSAPGHKRTRRVQIGMSALPPKAAAKVTERRGSLGPEGASIGFGP